MSNPGPSSSPKKEKVEKKETPRSPFQLKKASQSALSPNKLSLRVMTSLPDAQFINSLWELDSFTGNKIADCLSNVYSHVTQRGAHGQGKPQFFLHNAATALYESYEEFLINGKNHGIKSAAILNAVSNTLAYIESTLTRNLPPKKRIILENSQAELLAHQKALIQAIKTLPAQTQEHLKKHQNLDVDALEQPKLSPTKVARVKALHPQSPKIKTPKKLSSADRLAQMAFQATGPIDLDAAKTACESPTKFSSSAPTVESSGLLMVPRALRKQALKAAFSSITQKIDLAAKSNNALALATDEKESTLEIPSPIDELLGSPSKTVTFLQKEKMKALPKTTPVDEKPSLEPKSPKKGLKQI